MKEVSVINYPVLETPELFFGYHAWPTVCRGPEGELIAVCSGGRAAHTCPFGKVLLSRSYDEGKTWTKPQIIIDTPLDDRDGGVAVFYPVGSGKPRLIVTSFIHPVERQKNFSLVIREKHFEGFRDEYFKTADISSETSERYRGCTYVLSDDNGIHWSELKKSPVSAPHGPAPLKKGGLIYMGNPLGEETARGGGLSRLCVYYSPDGESWEPLSELDTPKSADTLFCEPYVAELPDGTLLAHIRVQNSAKKLFCFYQSKSYDGGKSWTKARRVNESGAPPHILLHSSGVLVSAYGYRSKPCGIRAILSRDGGNSWSEELVLRGDGYNGDLGYPSSVELLNGKILTVYYFKKNIDEPCCVLASEWELPKEYDQAEKTEFEDLPE